ncbi:hypothetical protein HN51_059162, partial [Arachis hypogaea]
KRQDALLKSWLLASMSKPFTTRMVGCMYTWKVWKRLEDHFSSQIKAKVMQLTNKLNTIQIGASVTEYVLAIKGTIDALASVGESVKESDHVIAILNGLTEEYSSLITSVLTTSRSQSITVGELEALLLSYESMLARFKRSEMLVQANLAQHYQYGQSQQMRRGFRGGFRGRGSRFRGGKNSYTGGRMMQESYS